MFDAKASVNGTICSKFKYGCDEWDPIQAVYQIAAMKTVDFNKRNSEMYYNASAKLTELPTLTIEESEYLLPMRDSNGSYVISLYNNSA